MSSFKKATVTGENGTAISYETLGKGPGLIIVHGALSNISEYTQLATALSDTYAVHLIQRRGSGIMDQECRDVLAVQQATNALFLFGHSYGGLVALETLMKDHPFKKVAVYEPGVSINRNWEWIPEYQEALTQRKYRRAFTSFVRGMGHSPLTKAPFWLAACILRIAIRGKDWELKKTLLESNLQEHLEVKRLEGTYEKYSNVSVPVLLAGGQASPDFIHHTLEVLKGVIPASEVQLLAKQEHLAPVNGDAPLLVADCIRGFFSNNS